MEAKGKLYSTYLFWVREKPEGWSQSYKFTSLFTGWRRILGWIVCQLFPGVEGKSRFQRAFRLSGHVVGGVRKDKVLPPGGRQVCNNSGYLCLKAFLRNAKESKKKLCVCLFKNIKSSCNYRKFHESSLKLMLEQGWTLVKVKMILDNYNIWHLSGDYWIWHSNQPWH